MTCFVRSEVGGDGGLLHVFERYVVTSRRPTRQSSNSGCGVERFAVELASLMRMSP